MPKNEIVFKELKDLYDELNSSIETTRDNVDVRKFKQQRALIKEIALYMQDYKWIKQQRLIDRVMFFNRNNFDYKKLAEEELKKVLKTEEISEEEYIRKLNAKYDAIKVSISYAGGVFLKKIGKSTLTLIREEKLEEAKMQFYLCSDKIKLDDFLLGSVVEKLPKGEYMPITLEECKEEIEFLDDYSLKKLEERKDKLDLEKLAYIVEVLTGGSPKLSKERLQLTERLFRKR